MSAWDEVLEIFGEKPKIDVRGPTDYNVSYLNWHVHNGACTSTLHGHGRSLESACRSLLKYCFENPASMVVKGACDWQCETKYSKSKKHQDAARKALRLVIEEASKTVDNWPAWKRGLDPCEDENCEREFGHAGKHRQAKPVEFDEW